MNPMVYVLIGLAVFCGLIAPVLMVGILLHHDWRQSRHLGVADRGHL